MDSRHGAGTRNGTNLKTITIKPIKVSFDRGSVTLNAKLLKTQRRITQNGFRASFFTRKNRYREITQRVTFTKNQKIFRFRFFSGYLFKLSLERH